MNHVDNPFKSPAVLSICAGIRGLERGVERAVGQLRTVAYVEIEAFAVENLLAGMESGVLAPAPIWSNLKTFPWEYFRGKVDLLLGGYPCQPFSVAGNRLGAADPRHLWPFIESGIRAIRPVCCFFENVAAHLNLGYSEVKRSLEEMGYVVKEGIYAAEEVGAPHQRARLFILGILANAERPSWWPHYSRGSGCDQNNLFEERSERADRSECSSAKLANSDSLRFESKHQVSARGHLFESCGESLADSSEQGLERQRAQTGGAGKEITLPAGRDDSRWPSRPGESQQAWESPRLISREAESSMGIRINGYCFREDLLRALGNGVVEQQAEYAFRDLVRKHFESLS